MTVDGKNLKSELISTIMSLTEGECKEILKKMWSDANCKEKTTTSGVD